MTMFYRNQCYSEGSYNEVDLYCEFSLEYERNRLVPLVTK